jgi:hypothetical protein
MSILNLEHYRDRLTFIRTKRKIPSLPPFPLTTLPSVSVSPGKMILKDGRLYIFSFLLHFCCFRLQKSEVWAFSESLGKSSSLKVWQAWGTLSLELGPSQNNRIHWHKVKCSDLSAVPCWYRSAAAAQGDWYTSGCSQPWQQACVHPSTPWFIYCTSIHIINNK